MSSFNFGTGGSTSAGSGFSFPTTSTSTGSSFSFGTATPATTSGGSSGGFTFSNVATSQAPTVADASPFSFSTAASTATVAPSSSFSFTNPPSSSTGGGGLLSGAPQASAPSSTFSFSAPTTTAATTTTGATSGLSAGFSFGGAAAAPTTTAAAPLSSFSFQPKPLGTVAPEPAKSTAATTSQPAFSFPTKPASATGGLLGATTTSATTSTTPAANTVLPTLFAPQPTASATTTTTTTTTTTAASLGLTTTIAPSSVAPATTTALTSLTTATSTSSGTIAPGATVGGGTLSVAGLEEKVNKWVSELREQEERLLRQAAHVNAWDQLLQHGHDQVQHLRSTLNKVKTDQTRLQAELDFIQGQQQELEQLIEPLEAAAAATTPAQHQGDRQRENMHLLAQNLDSQLRQMTDDLCKVIEHLNSNNSGSQASDPVNTVARVLSAHMDTLKWVDQNVALLNQKVDDLSRVTESKRRD